MRQLDNDHLSYYIKGISSVREAFMREIDNYGFVSISLMTHYEILKGLRYKDAKAQTKVYESLLPALNILPITEDVMQTAASLYGLLRNKGILFGDNDLLIGATAIVSNLKLVTNNTWHFSRIPGLQIENWTK